LWLKVWRSLSCVYCLIFSLWSTYSLLLTIFYWVTCFFLIDLEECSGILATSPLLGTCTANILFNGAFDFFKVLNLKNVQFIHLLTILVVTSLCMCVLFKKLFFLQGHIYIFLYYQHFILFHCRVTFHFWMYYTLFIDSSVLIHTVNYGSFQMFTFYR